MNTNECDSLYKWYIIDNYFLYTMWLKRCRFCLNKKVSNDTYVGTWIFW